MEVTLQDIAKELDVSAATVSRSLRHDKLIHPETRARVNEAARRMGYQTRVRRPRRVMESDTRSTTIGLLLRFNSLVAAQGDMNLTKMMAGIMEVADQQRVLLQVHTMRSQQDRTSETEVPLIAQHGVCQTLIVHGEHPEADLAYLAARLPVVTMGRVYPNLPIDSAVAGNVQGVRDLVVHLAELGHRRLAWVGAAYQSSFMEARQAGFLQGCLAHGLEMNPQWFFGKEVHIGREQVVPEPLLAAVKAGITGFVCGNDAIGVAVIKALESGGVQVPLDVSVTGFDAWTHARDVPHLTTVDPCFSQIGQMAARLSLQRLANPGGQPCIVSVRGQLVPGDTTATARIKDKG